MKFFQKILLLLASPALCLAACNGIECSIAEDNCGGHDVLSVNYFSKKDSTTNLYSYGTFSRDSLKFQCLAGADSSSVFMEGFESSGIVFLNIYDKKTVALVVEPRPNLSDTIWVSTGVAGVSKCCKGYPNVQFAVVDGDTTRWSSSFWKSINIYR